MAFQLPELPFPKDSLAPFLTPETFDYHHGKHHAAYVNNTNNVITSYSIHYTKLYDCASHRRFISGPTGLAAYLISQFECRPRLILLPKIEETDTCVDH